MRWARLELHVQRLKFQLGAQLRLGARNYRVRGYASNRFASGLDHEPHLLPLIARLLAGNQGAFVDVGVNIGQTLTKVLRVDAKRRYVGFEPQVACCFFVDQFLKDNALNRAQVLPLALSDENRVCQLFAHGEQDEMASLVSARDLSGRARELTTLVPCRVGDDVFEEMGLGSISVIKIDVEGAELRVLKGLRRTLALQRPCVIFEVLPNFYGPQRIFRDAETRLQNTALANELFSFLTVAGYEISQIDSAGRELSLARFELEDRDAYIGSDFLAAPRKRSLH